MVAYLSIGENDKECIHIGNANIISVTVYVKLLNGFSKRDV